MKVNKKWSRRQALQVMGAVAVATMPMPYINRAMADDQKFAGKTIRVLTWSDATGQAAVKNILKPFEKATGAKVIADLTGTTSDMIAKIKASAASQQYDLVILSGFGANTLADAGLLDKPDTAAMSNFADLAPEYQTGAKGFGLGYYLWSDGLLYNTAANAKPPKSYKVLWDAANKGKIFLPPAKNLLAMELIIVAAKLAGGDQKNPDAGFKMLADLKPNVLTISSNANQLADLFRSNSLNVGGVYSPLEMSEFIPKPEYNVGGTYDLDEGFFVDLQYMVVPKGHPGDKDVINALMNQAMDPHVQGMMAEEVWYGPTNQKAILSDKAKASPFIPSPEVVKSRVVKVDGEHLASVREDWIKRYTEAVGG